jgi:hypothetical protein
MTTQESLIRLFDKRKWHMNSGMNGSTARVYKMRFFDNKLEMETKMKILEACGYKIIQEMQWEKEIDIEQEKGI